jgi:YHS domain-containing protein
MFPGLLRIILYALIAYIVYTFLRAFQKLGQKSRAPRRSKKNTGLMVKDEVCNTYLPKEDALKEIREGKEHFFCSKECRQKFLSSKKS